MGFSLPRPPQPLPPPNYAGPPKSARVVAGGWGLVQSVTSVGGVWYAGHQGQLYHGLYSRTAEFYQMDFWDTNKVAFGIHRQRSLKKWMPFPPDLVLSVSQLNDQEKEQFFKTLSATIGGAAARDIFLEHGWLKRHPGVSVIPPFAFGSITLKLTQFLSKNKLFNLKECLSNSSFQSYISGPITSFIFFVFLPFGQVNVRVLHLFFLSHIFVFAVLGYIDSDRRFCEQYGEFFKNQEHPQNKLNLLIFTFNFVYTGTGSLLPKDAIFKKSDFGEVLARESYLDKNFFLNQCFQDDIYQLDI